MTRVHYTKSILFYFVGFPNFDVSDVNNQGSFNRDSTNFLNNFLLNDFLSPPSFPNNRASFDPFRFGDDFSDDDDTFNFARLDRMLSQNSQDTRTSQYPRAQPSPFLDDVMTNDVGFGFRDNAIDNTGDFFGNLFRDSSIQARNQQVQTSNQNLVDFSNQTSLSSSRRPSSPFDMLMPSMLANLGFHDDDSSSEEDDNFFPWLGLSSDFSANQPPWSFTPGFTPGLYRNSLNSRPLPSADPVMAVMGLEYEANMYAQGNSLEQLLGSGNADNRSNQGNTEILSSVVPDPFLDSSTIDSLTVSTGIADTTTVFPIVSTTPSSTANVERNMLKPIPDDLRDWIR